MPQQLCELCGRVKVSRLRTEGSLRVWAEDEGLKWQWRTPKQAYFRLCEACHTTVWPMDMRPGNRHNKPGAYFWKQTRGGRTRLLAGDLFITEAPPELLAPGADAGLTVNTHG